MWDPYTAWVGALAAPELPRDRHGEGPVIDPQDAQLQIKGRLAITHHPSCAMDLTREPVQIDGYSTSQVLDGSQDQPMSIMITHEQNKILRIPNRDMSLKQ